MTRPRQIGLLAVLAAAGCQLQIQYEPDAGVGAVALDAGLSPPDAQPLPCDAGFRNAVDKATGHCYMVFLERRTYAGAISSCQAIAARHAAVSGDDENGVIASAQPSISDVGAQTGVWLGGDDRDGDARYAWFTGEPFEYTAWRPGEPSFVGTGEVPESCLTMDLGIHVDGTAGYWNDRDCAATIPFVCERD
jgi:hypothetical protein